MCSVVRGVKRAADGFYEQVSIKGCLTGDEEGELTANIGFDKTKWGSEQVICSVDSVAGAGSLGNSGRRSRPAMARWNETLYARETINQYGVGQSSRQRPLLHGQL
jgi:hypothetical protein